MIDFNFRGYYLGDPEMPKQWVYGSLVKRQHPKFKNPSYYIETTKGEVFIVEKDSIGIEWINGLYHGDIFLVEGLYPFFDDNGDNNYLGVLEYVPDDGYCGWYYGLAPVSDKVRGSACGSGMADLEGQGIKVLGNMYQHQNNLESLRIQKGE